MLLSVPGMGALLIAGAMASAGSAIRRGAIYYACISSIVYTALVLYGAIEPVRFLVSFDFFELMCAPIVLSLLWIHGRASYLHRDSRESDRLLGWFIFSLVAALYYTYMILGIGPHLWQHGIWYTDDDVLHTGLICWVYYMQTRLSDQLTDSHRT
jgi:hypothetical protein